MGSTSCGSACPGMLGSCKSISEIKRKHALAVVLAEFPFCVFHLVPLRKNVCGFDQEGGDSNLVRSQDVQLYRNHL